jgi:hypothetical protein
MLLFVGVQSKGQGSHGLFTGSRSRSTHNLFETVRREALMGGGEYNRPGSYLRCIPAATALGPLTAIATLVSSRELTLSRALRATLRIAHRGHADAQPGARAAIGSIRLPEQVE